MSQYCPYCKWYSADGLPNCSTCGRSFDAEWDDSPEEDEAEERPLLERVGWGLALAAGTVVGGLALYGRFGTPQNLGRAGAALDAAANGLRTAVARAYTWLVGPNGEYKDFVVIALLLSAFLWLALWVAARLGRR